MCFFQISLTNWNQICSRRLDIYSRVKFGHSTLGVLLSYFNRSKSLVFLLHPPTVKMICFFQISLLNWHQICSRRLDIYSRVKFEPQHPMGASFFYFNRSKSLVFLLHPPCKYKRCVFSKYP